MESHFPTLLSVHFALTLTRLEDHLPTTTRPDQTCCQCKPSQHVKFFGMFMIFSKVKGFLKKRGADSGKFLKSGENIYKFLKSGENI